MPQTQFNIRAELPGGEYRDFKVGAETLKDARWRAQEHIEDNIMGIKLQSPNPTYDWRGQVVFVDCQPPEEVVRGQK